MDGQEKRSQTLKDLTTKFNNNSVENISSRTMRRRLFQNKYKRYVVSTKITIRRENIGSSVSVGGNCVGQLKIIGRK